MSADIEMTKITYVLAGPMAGRTVKLSKGAYNFVDGKLSFEVREDHVAKYAGMTRLLARCYNAHPEGSKALAKAQAEWQVHPQNAGKKGKTDVGGQADKAGKAKAASPASKDEGSDGAEAGAQGHDADGGDDLGAGDGEEGDVPSEVAVALGQLDPDNSKHWTTSGLPNLKALSEIMGRSVTRPEIEEAVPGFNREAAAENKE